MAAAAEGAFALSDGSGLGDADGDRLFEHGTSEQTMWATGSDAAQEGIIFDLHGLQTVESIAVWNYNKPGYTDYGVAKAVLSAWTQDGGWKPLLAEAVFDEAEGTGDYDMPTVLRFTPVKAGKIRFEKMTAFNPKAAQVGLSEVVFHGPLGPAAFNPEPRDGAQVPVRDPLRLTWTAGKDAVAHDVYAAVDDLPPVRLGRIKGTPQVELAGLQPGQRCCWRIDEVTKDAAVTEGPTWSFKASGSRVGYWPLDGDVNDAAGRHNGTFAGEPTWQEGHARQALTFNGASEAVEIPALNLNTDSMTICAWVQAQTQPSEISGIVFSRAGQTVAGLNLEGDRLRYHWNDDSRTWEWDSGLTVPTDGTWVFVALTVEPQRGTLYICRDGQWTAAVNPIRHTTEEFDGPICLGCDPQGDRCFAGAIDEVRIFDYALSGEQLRSLVEGVEFAAVGVETLRLVNADLVEEGQSLKAIAAESTQAEPPRKRNLLPVLVIAALIAGVAGLSALGKKKK